MKASMQWLKKCNELRKAEGLGELYVNDYFMAIAQSNSNVSAKTMNHMGQFNVGENLAWGNHNKEGGPFYSWYTDCLLYTSRCV